MFAWLRSKVREIREHHETSEALRRENLRLIAVAPAENLDQATVCLREFGKRKGSSATLPKVKP